MASADAMETYAARLASFCIAHPATKKRASDSKGAKTIKWPHKTPSTADLAKAGFFFRPTSSCPDNTTCFLCKKGIDGWEEDDNAITEHLRLSPDCGWAINASIEQDIESGIRDDENPMSERMVNARQLTFGNMWPHDGKRGWTCKTQKMIEAGWYYCPTPESDDFVKCAYCNLSLDGWEPKDNPYDEHQRRSQDCMFFVLAAPLSSKLGRAKKGRPSKMSRVSMQSNTTAASEEPSLADIVDDEDVVAPIPNANTIAAPVITKGSKKAAKSKKQNARGKIKTARANVEESTLGSSFIEPEDDDFEVKVQQVPLRNTRNKKRTSDELGSNDTAQSAGDAENVQGQPPPAKRRMTRTRSSIAQQAHDSPVTAIQDKIDNDTPMTDTDTMPPPRMLISMKSERASRKRASSTVRKASNTSTASKASLRAAVPADDEIDAALEKDLDRPLTDEDKPEPVEDTQPKTRRLTRTRPGPKVATASVTHVRSSTIVGDMVEKSIPAGGLLMNRSGGEFSPKLRAQPKEDSALALKVKKTKGRALCKVSANDQTHVDHGVDELRVVQIATHEKADEVDETEAMPKRAKSRQPSRQLPGRRMKGSVLSASHNPIELSQTVISAVGWSLDTQDPEHEINTSIVSRGIVDQGIEESITSARKGKAEGKVALMSQNIEDVAKPGANDAETQEDQGACGEDVVIVDDVQPEPADVEMTSATPSEIESASREPKAKRKAGRPAKPENSNPKTKTKILASSVLASPNPRSEIMGQKRHIMVSSPITHASEPIASSIPAPSAHATPLSSPQSSDAENQPPSSRPSTVRPPLSMHSPSRHQTTRIPLAASTPISSPSKRNISKLQTTMPWTAVDFERFFLGPPTGDKENEPFVRSAIVDGINSGLTSPERKMNVEEWMQFNAKKGEEKLRNECERLVGQFESQGLRALRTLEGIACIE